jgi:ubiquinone biosynthesis protein
MKKIGQLSRLFYINYVMAKRRIDRVVLSAPFFARIRFLSFLNPWHWYGDKNQTPGQSIRLALEDLGPIFIKFGQMLSTRQDLLPEDVIAELSKLQDKVPSFPSDAAQKTVEQSLKSPISVLFATFSYEPMASASIAQVHTATLHDGRQVVVKIRRPHIEKIIRRDLGLMYFVAGCAERFWSHGRRLRLRDLVKEFEHTILDELDFLHEAANASQLRRNFKDSTLLYVPEVHWEYTTHDVFVMERIFGVPISDMVSLEAAQTDVRKLAENGVEIFFTQVFRDSFFHADMHPGNIFVSLDDPENPRYMAVDFGIMGSLSPQDQHYLAENLLAFFKRDYRRVAILHVESGWVPAGTRIEEFESAIRSVCEPVFEKPLRDISFAQLLLRLFQTAGRFNMEIQPQLFLLQKTLLNIEGLGRRLYPDLDLWVTAQPFLERWMRRRYSPRTLLKKWFRQAPHIADSMMRLPALWQTVLEQHKQAQSRLQQVSTQDTRQKNGSAWKYFLLGMLLAAMLISLFLIFSHRV